MAAPPPVSKGESGTETGAEAEAEAGEGRPRGGLKCHLVMLYTGCGKEHR